MASISFSIKVLHRYWENQPRACPYCAGKETELLGRKKFLLELRRCQKCQLMFRYPQDVPQENAQFYQDEYEEGMTTGIPIQSELDQLLSTNFFGTEKDLSLKIQLIQDQCPSGHLLDYGCSWGYGMVQFKKAGYEVVGFEISNVRAQFGRQTLGLDILSHLGDLQALPGNCFDVIIANHVLEHLCEPKIAFEIWKRLLKPDGTLFIFVPNAGGNQAKMYGPNWGPMIGEKHPLAVDANFLFQNLPNHGLIPRFCSSPYSQGVLKLEKDPFVPSLAGDELLAVVKPNFEQAQR
jgi:SAM-dependent methyltransferase